MSADPAIIKNMSCFQDFSDQQVADIAAISNIMIYPPEHTIFEEGVIGKKLFFLISGKVEILFNLGRSKLSRIDIKAGEDIMGCSALMEPNMYTATNRSLSEVEVLEVDIVQLKELMQKNCELGLFIQKQQIKFMQDYILKLRSLLMTS